MLTLYDRELGNVIPLVIIGGPYIVFEAMIGPRLMIKAMRAGSETR